jgi:hypothetical protein
MAGGERGLELAIVASADRGRSFEKVLKLDKLSLTSGSQRVLSIEGSALYWTRDGVELFVSTEKDGIGYPSGFEPFLKPGTGVWSIDRLSAANVAALSEVTPETVIESRDSRYVHVKDPFLRELPGGLLLLFCTHPYWRAT